jgi:hypothetical protein
MYREQSMKNSAAVYFILLLFVLQASGCASIEKDMANFWNSPNGSQTEKQGSTREDAIQKYGYKGERDEIYTDSPILIPAVARPGDTINHKLQYALLAPQGNKRFVVSEFIILYSSRETMDLIKREAEKPQGIHVSTFQFTIPKDLDPGIYKIITTISSGSLKKTVEGEFVVKQ